MFGVCCEAIPEQVNYLIDECMDTGKGANTVISYLHHYLQNHGIRAYKIHLNADNCTGQNKNNALMQYLAWRVLTGLNKSIKISFLPVGHTKFSPDCGFGLFKQRFRKTDVGCLEDIARVVDESSVMNVPQLVGTSSGEVIVQSFDWTGYLAPHFKVIKGIKRIHHFTFEEHSLRGGHLITQFTCSDSPIAVPFLKVTNVSLPSTMPPMVPPKGLTAKRQWYLFEKIREFCPDNSKDKTCPLPEVPKPSSTCHSPESAMVSSSEEEPASPAEKRRRVVCGNCKQSGHNRRSCPHL